MLPLIAAGLGSCEKKVAPPMQMPPAAVSFVPVASEKVELTRDLPGRVDAVRVAEVRARVAGIMLQRTFDEGANVKAGQTLFKIDPAPLEAAKASATASLAKANANLKQAQTTANRYAELVNVKAISRQDYDVAQAAVQTAQAEVQTADAAIKTADLNLGYATVTAPIDGRIGKALVTEGALVGQTDATKMAVIQQLDPIYVDFTQSSTDLLALRRALKEGKLDKDGASPVKLLLEDGTEYPQAGKLLFSEVSVDETTGMVSLRAQFPNPEHTLLPGMFARVRLTQALKDNSITVPQQAVTRGQGGAGSVLVIDDSNHVQVRMIRTDAAVGNKWVVTEGLKAGERVVMEGHLKARPGAEVKPEPFVPKTASSDNGKKASDKG
ncbi:efflux RND transporter periplasmic adaptor subunit [Luteolibacter sp. LG18]|uniref:efflux RND transporter periplasmic adaptor subunit n=1 Tax=Luteolibacter sp. LG18 TaxID=2819286 RepID=UPI0030C66EB2